MPTVRLPFYSVTQLYHVAMTVVITDATDG